MTSENSTTETISNGHSKMPEDDKNIPVKEAEGSSRQLLENQGTQLLHDQPLGENKDDQSVTIEPAEIFEKEDDHGIYKWVVVFSGFLQHFITGGFERSDGVLYLKLINKFNNSAQATAWVGSLCSTIRLVLGPVASMVSNRFSSRVAVIAGGILFALGIILSGFAPNLLFLYFSFGLIQGIGRALSYAPGLVTVGQYFGKRPGLAVGLATSGVGAGTFVIPPLFNFLFEEFDFLGAFLILGAIPLNICVCGALFRPLPLHRKIMASHRRKQSMKLQENIENGVGTSEPETSTLLLENKSAEDMTKQTNGHSSQDIPIKSEITTKPFYSSQTSITFEYTTDVGDDAPSFWTKLFECCTPIKPEQKTKRSQKLLDISLLKNIPFLLFCISICLFTLSFKSAFTFLPPLAKSRGCTESEAALLMSIAGVVDTIGRILAGFILDLKPIRRLRPFIYNSIMFLIAALSFIAPSLYSFWSFAILCGVFGAFTGAYVSQKSIIIVDILGVEKLSSSLGIMIFFQGIGTLIGPPLSGVLKDVFGDFTEAFYFGGAVLVLSAIVMIFSNILLSTQRKKEVCEVDIRKQSLK